MDFFTNAYFSLAIGIGAAIGWIRFRQIDPAFYPFLFLVWTALAHEVGSIFILQQGYSNVLLFNSFILAEALLLCWQFYRWKVFRSRRSYLSLQAFLFCWWAVEWALTPLYSFSSYFIILYSFLLVLLSITCINQLLFRDQQPLFRNPVFLLCLSFILYFSFSTLVETFWVFGLKQSKIFRLKVHAILCYINLLANLIFALAILWMPTKLQFILRS